MPMHAQSPNAEVHCSPKLSNYMWSRVVRSKTKSIVVIMPLWLLMQVCRGKSMYNELAKAIKDANVKQPDCAWNRKYCIINECVIFI